MTRLKIITNYFYCTDLIVCPVRARIAARRGGAAAAAAASQPATPSSPMFPWWSHRIFSLVTYLHIAPRHRRHCGHTARRQRRPPPPHRATPTIGSFRRMHALRPSRVGEAARHRTSPPPHHYTYANQPIFSALFSSVVIVAKMNHHIRV